jgi:N-methylhydantoinase A/oxoprolinase/acetone carboxylase beta subunit
VTAFCEEQRSPPSQITEIVHATTVATNAILERKGARSALLTTAGFRDVLELRRMHPMSYNRAGKTAAASSSASCGSRSRSASMRAAMF